MQPIYTKTVTHEPFSRPRCKVSPSRITTLSKPLYNINRIHNSHPKPEKESERNREMTVLKSNILLLAIFAVAGILFSGDKNMAVGQPCQGDMQGLITQCALFVQKNVPKMNPSPGCCGVIKSVDIPCVCQHITKDIEQMIDMEKVVFVAQYCGRPLAQGTKCGSKKLFNHLFGTLVIIKRVINY